MGVMEKLVGLRRFRAVRELLLLYGLDIPAAVQIGSGLVLQHRGMGTVIHPATTLGQNVTLYHQVTIGRADAHVPWEQSLMERIVIEDGVILYPGAKVLGGAGTTTVGRSTILAANAVLTRSTGDWEIWGGVPARKLGDRERHDGATRDASATPATEH